MEVDTPVTASHATDDSIYLRGALDSAGSVIYTIDRSFRIMTVNAAWDWFATNHGAPHLRGSAVVGTNLLAWLHEPQRDQAQRVCEAIFAGRLPRYECELDCSRFGTRSVSSLVISPLRDAAASIVGASFVCHDITHLKSLEDEVRARNDELRGLVAEVRRQHAAVERERDRAQALGRVIATLNESLSMQATVNTLLAIATQLVQVPAAAVYLLSGDNSRFIPWGSSGIDLARTAPEAFSLATSVAGRVLQRGEPREVADSSALDGVVVPFLSDGSLPRSLYVAPICANVKPIGVLEVYSPDPRSFDPAEQAMLTTLATSAGIALVNVQLYDEQVRGRKQAEELAQLAAEQAAQLSATIGAMTDGVWICDPTGCIVMLNDAAARMLGLCREELSGQPVEILSQIICRGDRRHLGLRAALAGESVHTECSVELHDTGKELAVDICATPIVDPSGAITGAVTVVRDISRAKAMDRLKEDFLSIAAHELKTPITALKGYAQLALKRIGDTPEVSSARRYLETIDEQADRITGLVQKLLDVSRIHAGKLDLQASRFDLYELIQVVADRVQLVSGHHTVHIEAVPVMVVADMQRIEQVLYNLLDNAVKYSPEGGIIRVELEPTPTRALVTVSDQGLGIPAEKLPYIFDRWYQAHHGTYGDYGGMGLGLYICKEIIERHGGSMWARSEEEGGSSIGFVIPLSPPPMASSA